VPGYAEITVYSASIIHNAIGEFDWRHWIRRLPDHPDLHTTADSLGLDSLIEKITDSNVTYQVGDGENKEVVFAADLQFSSSLATNPAKGGIIFEAAYSEHINHAREKAKQYLWDSDPPQPSVVVVFIKKGTGEAYSDVELNFEVHRRDPGGNREIKVYEKGVSTSIEFESD